MWKENVCVLKENICMWEENVCVRGPEWIMSCMAPHIAVLRHLVASWVCVIRFNSSQSVLRRSQCRGGVLPSCGRLWGQIVCWRWCVAWVPKVGRGSLTAICCIVASEPLPWLKLFLLYYLFCIIPVCSVPAGNWKWEPTCLVLLWVVFCWINELYFQFYAVCLYLP